MVRFNKKYLDTYFPKFPKPGQKKRKPLPKVTESEKILQSRAEEYLLSMDIAFIRLPDAMLRVIFANPVIPPHQKKLISSYIKGLPDLTIFHPCLKVGKYPVTLCLELKTERGKMSPSQVYWQDKVGTVEVKGWEEIKSEIDLFLNHQNSD